jgi:glutathione transport system substrate-binding protein
MQRYISMNVTQKPFDNPKVREAINYAINRQALVKVAFAGYATPATGVVPPSIAYAESFKPWPYDPAKARELLKEAGFPNGFSTTLWSSHNHSTAQKVLQFTQQQLAQVGIKAQLTAMDAGQRAAEVEGKGQKESGCGCSTPAGRLQPAKLTGRCHRCLLRKTGRRPCSTPRFMAIRRWIKI